MLLFYCEINNEIFVCLGDGVVVLVLHFIENK